MILEEKKEDCESDYFNEKFIAFSLIALKDFCL
jgi:hypothetical protein